MTDTITVPEGTDTLRAQFNGQVILPEDAAYDERRAHFHTTHDKHPAVIVVPSGTADVVAAVKFARAADLEIAVSSGGKHPAGFSRTDGGIVIDLSGMRAVKVDPEEQTAWLQAGANGGDLQAEAGLHGFGGISGWMRGTGVGGVNLNGGFGTLSNKLGFGVDTILELELVTAEGEVLRVAPDETRTSSGPCAARRRTSGWSPGSSSVSRRCPRKLRQAFSSSELRKCPRSWGHSSDTCSRPPRT